MQRTPNEIEERVFDAWNALTILCACGHQGRAHSVNGQSPCLLCSCDAWVKSGQTA